MMYARVRIDMKPLGEQPRNHPIYPRGRVTQTWYMPHFRVGPDGEYLGVAFLDGPASLGAGQSGDCEVVFMYDGVDYSPLREGTGFTVMEGRSVIADGVVLKRWETSDPWHGLAGA